MKRINKVMPLTNDQETKMRSYLPGYLKSLQGKSHQIEALLDPNIQSTGDLYLRIKKAKEIYRNAAINFLPIIIPSMIEFDENQRKTFFETIKKQNRKLERVTDNDNFRKAKDRLTYFLGDLNDNQIEYFDQNKNLFTLPHFSRVKRRKTLQENLELILIKDVKFDKKDKLLQVAFKRYLATNEDPITDKKFAKVIHDLYVLGGDEAKESVKNRFAEFKEWIILFKKESYN